MRILVCGSRSFGAAALRALEQDGHDVAAAAGPGSDDDALRLEAELLRVPWIPAAELRAETVPDQVDVIVAAHSHAYLGRRTLHRARLGGIGYHPSLLPRHRGRDAVRWTVHLGDPVAGGTVYWLSENVDAGDIAAQDWCWVRPGDDASTLWRRDLFPMGIRLLRRVLADLDDGLVVRLPQDEEVATWEPSWERAPLHRPELPLLGRLDGYRVVRERA